MAPSLSSQLREGTKEAHISAERSPFIRYFLAGRLSREVYRKFLVQLHHIYSALEEHQQRHRDPEVLGKLNYPRLYRREPLLQDLSFYYGDQEWEDLPPHDTTQAYVQQLQALSNEWVEGLVAHHYTRYLGDLSGGQTLMRIVAKTFDLPSSEGLAFYKFPQIVDHDQFKGQYRAQLDSLPVDPDMADRIVDEAIHAFDLNRAVFDSMMELIA